MKPPETHNPYYTHFPNESFQWYIYGLVIIRSVLALFELVILMSGISFPFQDGDRGAKCLFWMFPPLTVAFNLVTLFGSFTVKMCNMPVYVSQWYDDDVSPYHQKETLNLETLSGLLEVWFALISFIVHNSNLSTPILIIADRGACKKGGNWWIWFFFCFGRSRVVHAGGGLLYSKNLVQRRRKGSPCGNTKKVHNYVLYVVWYHLHKLCYLCIWQ